MSKLESGVTLGRKWLTRHHRRQALSLRLLATKQISVNLKLILKRLFLHQVEAQVRGYVRPIPGAVVVLVLVLVAARVAVQALQLRLEQWPAAVREELGEPLCPHDYPDPKFPPRLGRGPLRRLCIWND